MDEYYKVVRVEEDGELTDIGMPLLFEETAAKFVDKFNCDAEGTTYKYIPIPIVRLSQP